jgi:hypothetical protein
MPVSGPFRGVHLSHGGDVSSADLTALGEFTPGAAVALLNDVYAYTQSGANPNLFNWLKNNQSSVEIFLRYFPCPVVPLNTPGYQNYPKILAGSAQYITASAAAQDIVNQANAIKGQGLTNFRIIVGNEPEIEWDTDGSAQWYTSFWQDVDNYFKTIYDDVVNLGRPVELYPPAFMQFAFVAVSNVNYNGTVNRLAVSANGPIAYSGADTDFGAYYVTDLLNHYNNGTGVGRMVVHSYFYPGYQAQQVIDAFLPSFILSMVSGGMPARVTEFGWYPNAIECSASPEGSCWPASLDTTTSSCDGARNGISAAGDYNDYVRNRAKLGGYNFWLLADPTNATPGSVAVTYSGTIRYWFSQLIGYYNQ